MKIFINRRKFILIISNIVVLPCAIYANVYDGDVVEIRDRIRCFVKDWLENGDINSALGYFDQDIFSSDAMYQGDCASFGALSFYTDSKRDCKQAIMLALEWYNKELQGDHKFLPPEEVDISTEFGIYPLNDPKFDNFFIFSDDKLQRIPFISNDETFVRIKSVVMDRNFYFVIFPLKIGACFFIWIKRNNSWKILHAETIFE